MADVPLPPSPSAPPSDSDSPPCGPMTTLAQKAAPLLRTAENSLPETAQPALSRTKKQASKLLTIADGHLLSAKTHTLDTPEGRHFYEALLNLASTILPFCLMLFHAALSATETFFQIPPSEDQNSVPKRAVAVCVAVANRADQALEVRQNAASPPWQVCLCSNVRAFARIALALFICITAALLNFNGPGAPVILPSVEYIVSILPEDLQKAVRDDDIHPIDTVRNQLRLASRSNVLSDNSAQRPETVQHSEN